MSSKFYLVRHAESAWNKANRFTGQIDVGLSLEGIEQALNIQIEDSIDLVFTSELIRSKMTAALMMTKQEKGLIFNPTNAINGNISVFSKKELNERHYGTLQGLNKDEVRAQYGKEKVKLWRRSFKEIPPGGESLEMVVQRVKPFADELIKLASSGAAKTILVVAHGNSLRALAMLWEGLSEEEILEREIELGSVLTYQLIKGKPCPLT